MVDRQRGIDEVDVRVDDPGHRDLARLELDPAGVRVGAGLEVDRRAGERDLAVADPDRLDPAEAGIAGERGDPTGDEHVERHQADAAHDRPVGRGAALEHRAPARRVGEQLGERVAVQAGAEARRERDPRLRPGEVAREQRAGALPRRAAAGERVARPRGAGRAARGERDDDPLLDRPRRGLEERRRGVPGARRLDDDPRRAEARPRRRAARRPSRRGR